MQSQSAYFEQLRNLLAELTGNEAGDIHPDSLMVDDLGIADEADLPRIVKRINAHFDIHLATSDVANEAETVEDLLMLITDEAELG
ncbi:MAG: phosphopantetheine-binding protein [Patescibacteria group bacterium]